MSSSSGLWDITRCGMPAGGPDSSRQVVRQLNHEWEFLRNTVAEWLEDTPSLDTLLASIPADPDRVIMGLVSACQRGFPMAGRVVVQAMLPKLVLMSRSYPHPGVDHLVSALWTRIASYPLYRRRRAIASNLVLDARKDVLAESKAPAVLLPVGNERSFSAGEVVGIARTLGLATASSLAILESVYVEGLPPDSVASMHGISNNAVRKRCSETLRRLREHRNLLSDLLST